MDLKSGAGKQISERGTCRISMGTSSSDNSQLDYQRLFSAEAIQYSGIDAFQNSVCLKGFCKIFHTLSNSGLGTDLVGRQCLVRIHLKGKGDVE